LAFAFAAVALGACGQTYNRNAPATTSKATPSVVAAVAPEKSSQLASLGPIEVEKQRISCVPYARTVSGVEIRGDAWTWWDGAKGIYERGALPEVGAIIVMKRGGRLDRGHVGMVTAVLNSREIQIDHANWRRGEVHLGALVRDVSTRNDWSVVQVWYPPIGDYGTGRYPLAGFIYPRHPAS